MTRIMNMKQTNNQFNQGLDRCAANYAPLTPLTLLERAALVYPDQLAVIDGKVIKTWLQVYTRCRQFASALCKHGIGIDDTVAIIAPNTLAMYEAHFAVPMAGAVLNTINTRLDAETIAYILDHGEAKVLLIDGELTTLVEKALRLLDREILIIDIKVSAADQLLGTISYDEFLQQGDADFRWVPPADEWDAIALNYTSGTTGKPKGVVYHHRGAYLNALSNVVGWQMVHHPVYLWTVPMFHCNGWCFPWTLAALAGTSICLRNVNAASIFTAIARHKVTHFGGAPVIMNMIINASEKERSVFTHEVNMMTAAAPPPASVLSAMEEQGFRVTHVYGLTETYGPAVICAWNEDWEDLPLDQRIEKKSRQGVRYHVLEELDVMNPKSMQSVEQNGQSMGEVMFRGNIVMKGYFKSPQATAEAFAGGWFHSGDLAVRHSDGYVQLKDRSKDIIISGGENISSIEIENVLFKHPAVLEAAVVAKPDTHWGETPCAFVTLKDKMQATEQEIIDFCRDNMAHFKAPKTVVFAELPKTSTGKIQKFKLRQQIDSMDAV